MAMSSMALTFAGSRMATTSVAWPMNPTGTASRRLATSGAIRLAAAMSTAKFDRWTWSTPKRKASASASWSPVMMLGVDEILADRLARAARRGHRGLDGFAVDMAELDEDLAEQRALAAGRAGRENGLDR